jgi:hypothetical protein
MDEEREGEAAPDQPLAVAETASESEPEPGENPVAEAHETEDTPPTVDDPEQTSLSEETETLVGDSDADVQQLIAEIEETLSASSAMATTSECSADQSSPPTDQGVDLHKNKRLSKHKPDESGESSNESVRSLSVEEATLPVREEVTPPPTSPKETQTDWLASGVEVINLPLLKEMRPVDGAQESKRVEEKVLGTGISAHFKGPMPTVILPLDKYNSLGFLMTNISVVTFQAI